MSEYIKGCCCICGRRITIESGCVPICDSPVCEHEWDEANPEAEEAEREEKENQAND
jgi:hypothetical protein